MLNDQLTTLTDAHRRVMNSLEAMGFGVMEEIPFPPYQVDLYLPDYHVVVEIDGPLHNKRRDMKRDTELHGEYGLYVFRISTRFLDSIYWAGNLEDFLFKASQTKDERWERAELRIPWI